MSKRVAKMWGIPLGSWDMQTGAWQPNQLLKMTPDEQVEHNVQNGFNPFGFPNDPIDATIRDMFVATGI